MKTEIYNLLSFVADFNNQSVIELVTKNLKPVDLEKDCDLISFDEGKTYYKRLDLECLYMDERHQIYLDSGGTI